MPGGLCGVPGGFCCVTGVRVCVVPGVVCGVLWVFLGCIRRARPVTPAGARGGGGSSSMHQTRHAHSFGSVVWTTHRQRILVGLRTPRSKMPQSFGSCRFEWKPCGEQSPIDAYMTIVHHKFWHTGLPGWRAVFSIGHGTRTKKVHRKWGNTAPSMSAAVDLIIDKHMRSISTDDADKLRSFAATAQNRRTNTAVTSAPAVPAGNSIQRRTSGGPAPSQVSRKTVAYIHQIYLDFGGGNPMEDSDLFMTSSRMWSELAGKMGAKYILWNDSLLESLVSQRFPAYWDIYKSVRYPVQRVDMGRLFVLLEYGGLYADLDVIPNRTFYEQCWMAVLRVERPKQSWKETRDDVARSLDDKKNGRRHPRTPSLSTCDLLSSGDNSSTTVYYEMEVLIAVRGCTLMSAWLGHMRDRIARTDWKDHGFWKDAKARYVLHTTGTSAMNRFLKLPANKKHMACVKLLSCNYFHHKSALSEAQERQFDVLTHTSNAYFTTEDSITVAVGPGDLVLPSPPPSQMRLRGKQAAKAASAAAAPLQVRWRKRLAVKSAPAEAALVTACGAAPSAGQPRHALARGTAAAQAAPSPASKPAAPAVRDAECAEGSQSRTDGSSSRRQGGAKRPRAHVAELTGLEDVPAKRVARGVDSQGAEGSAGATVGDRDAANADAAAEIDEMGGEAEPAAMMEGTQMANPMMMGMAAEGDVDLDGVTNAADEGDDGCRTPEEADDEGCLTPGEADDGHAAMVSRGHDEKMRDTLRALFGRYRGAVAFETVLEEMPDGLRKWVLSPTNKVML